MYWARQRRQSEALSTATIDNLLLARLKLHKLESPSSEFSSVERASVSSFRFETFIHLSCFLDITFDALVVDSEHPARQRSERVLLQENLKLLEDCILGRNSKIFKQCDLRCTVTVKDTIYSTSPSDFQR
jgi:hypothetical protein